MFFCGREAKEQAYFSLVRPRVEYACSLWDPSTKDLIKKLEAVQRSIRFVMGNYVREEGVVTGLLQDRRWLPLAERRKICRLSMMYKMHKEEVSIDFNKYFQIRSTRTS